MVSRSREKASDSSNRNPDREWGREEIARPSSNPDEAFGDLDTDPSAENPSHDRLAVDPVREPPPISRESGKIGYRGEQS